MTMKNQSDKQKTTELDRMYAVALKQDVVEVTPDEIGILPPVLSHTILLDEMTAQETRNKGNVTDIDIWFAEAVEREAQVLSRIRDKIYKS